MAKLTAPLLSLGASGQIGKAVVHFPWKGINAAREYVVPANPRTTAQTTQRAKLKAAVALIHAVMQAAAHPLDAADKIAYALWGSTFATPRTWFNQIIKQLVDMSVAGLGMAIWTDGGVTPGASQLVISVWNVGDDMTAARAYYGTTKACTMGYINTADAAGNHTATIPNLTAGVKYYIQVICTAPAAYIGTRSGVYYGVPT